MCRDGTAVLSAMAGFGRLQIVALSARIFERGNGVALSAVGSKQAVRVKAHLAFGQLRVF